MTKQSNFSPDAPISSAAEDRLGLLPFVRRLAKPILLSQRDRSLVVGVYGRWGSGKTSALQLLQHELEATRHFEGALGRTYPRALVIPFTPWLYGSVEALLAAFFDTLASGIGGMKAAPKRTRALVEGSVRAMGTFLLPTARVVGHLAGVAQMPLAKVAVEATAAVAKGASEFMEATKGAADEGRFQRQKAKASKALRDLSAQGQPVRVVMLIDDLDRSAGVDELLLMLKLVKLVADLPNVTYVLAMDREHVEGLLRRVGSDRFAEEYLDKIVQVGVTVPPPDPARLTAWLLAEAREIAAAVGMPTASVDPLEETGWSEYVELPSFRRLVSDAIRTPRDVNRVLNLFRFSATTGETPPPFHAGDLLLLCILQVVAPAVYRAVQANGRFLCGRERSINEALRDTTAEQTRKARAAARFDAIVRGQANVVVRHDVDPRVNPLPPAAVMDGQEIRGVRAILEHLFPAMSTAYRRLIDVEDGDRTGYRADRVDYRLRSPGRFSAYFRFSQEEHAVPPSIVNGVVALLTRADGVLGDLEAADRSSRLTETFSKLSGEQRASLVEEVANALFALPLAPLRSGAVVLPKILQAGRFEDDDAVEKWSIEIISALTGTIASGIPRARKTDDWDVDRVVAATLVGEIAAAMAHLSPVRAVIYVRDILRDRDLRQVVSGADALAPLLVRSRGWVEHVLATVPDVFADGDWETAIGFLWSASELEQVSVETDVGSGVSGLRDYLRRLLSRMPERTSHVLALAAWWSGEAPALREREPGDIQRVLHRFVGCDYLDDLLGAGSGDGPASTWVSEVDQQWPNLLEEYRALRARRPDEGQPPASLDHA